MNIYDSVYLDVDSNIFSEAGRGVNEEVGSDYGASVRSSDNERFELEVGDKFGSVNVRSVCEGVKGVKGKVNGVFGISVCWCVDVGVGTGNDSSNRITFGVDDGYDIGFNDILFYGYIVDKPMAHI